MFYTTKNVMALYLTTALAVASQPAFSAILTPDEQANKNSSEKISFGNQLVDAAEYGDNALLKELLKSGENPNQRGDFETTALLRAAFHGNLETIKILLLAGANPNLSDIGGATPLHVASREGHMSAVDMLMRSGATVNIADSEGYTPLMRATMNGEKKILGGLIANGADIEAKNQFGETAVEQATKTKDKEIVNILLAKEADSKPLPLQVADISRNSAASDDASAQALSELTPASGWAEAVSSQLFGSEYMLMAIADSKAVTNGSFNMLDFGSYKTEDEAKTKLEELKTKYSDTLKGLNVVVVEKSSGDNKAYHINAGLLDTKEEAVERCKTLVSKGVICRPVETKMMVTELNKPTAALKDKTVKPEAEAAPSPSVEKAELPAIPKFHVAKEDVKNAATNEIKPASTPVPLKTAATESKAIDVTKLPIVVAKSEAIDAPAKTEKLASNATNLNASKNPEVKPESDSFFGSLFSDDKKEAAKPAVKDLPIIANETKPAPKITTKIAEKSPEAAAEKPVNSDNPLMMSKSEAKAEKNMLAGKSAIGDLSAPEKVAVTSPKEEVKTAAAPKEMPKKELSKQDIRNLPIVASSKIEEEQAPAPKIAVSKAEPAPKPVEKKIVAAEAAPKAAEKKVIVAAAAPKAELPKLETKTESNASDAFKSLPPLKTSAPEAAPLLPKPTPGIEKAANTPLEMPRDVARIEPEKVAKVEPKITATPKVAAYVAPAPIAVAAAPAPVYTAPVVASAPAYVAPVIAPIPAAPQQTYVASEVPVPPINSSVTVTRKNPQPAAQIQPQSPVIATVQQAYIAPAPAPVQPVYPTNNSTIVVTKKTPQPEAAPVQIAAPAPVPIQVQPQYQPAPQQYSYAPPAPVYQPAPVQAPIQAAPASYINPSQVVVSSRGASNNYVTPAYTAPVQVQQPQYQSQQYQTQQIAQDVPQYQPRQQFQQTEAERPVNSGKELWVSVGYFTTQSAARGFWNRVSASNSDLLPKFRMKTTRPTGDSGRVMAEIGPIYNNGEANNVCNIISSEGLSCEITSSLRQAGSTDKYQHFISGQRHSELSSGSDYGTVGDEIASSSYNSWSLQLGTFDSKDAARSTWENMQTRNRILSKMEPSINSADGSSRLRLRAGKFTSSEAAQDACEQLRRNYVSCIIVRSS